jgi:hypothetical protein
MLNGVVLEVEMPVGGEVSLLEKNPAKVKRRVSMKVKVMTMEPPTHYRQFSTIPDMKINILRTPPHQ